VVLRVAEAADRLGLSPSSLYAMAAAGKIGCHRVGPSGGAIRFTEEQLAAYLAATRSSEERKPSLPPRRSGPRLRLRDLRL
jgi:excisionase family DNA binding protein